MWQQSDFGAGKRVHSRVAAARCLVFFAVLLLVCSAAPVLAAEHPGGPDIETPSPALPEDFDPSKLPSTEDVTAAIEKAEREETERKAWLAGPDAARQREESRFAYADLDATQSMELFRTTFAEQMAQLNQDPARVLSDAQLLSSSEETSATIRDEGNGLLLESDLPVRAEDEEGDLRKVDVSLEETASGFATENGLVSVQIPDTAAEPIEVGEEGVSIKLAGADDDRLTRPFGDENVFAPDVLPDTDMLVSPIATGVEIFNLLRSEDSPEELRFRVQMPSGAELRADGDWGADVVKDGEVLTTIREPIAVDAQGTNVPVDLEVEGDSLLLSVEHRGRDYAMPILLDPILENNENWIYGQNHNALDMGVWSFQNNGSWWFHGSTNCIYECFGPGGAGTRGLFVSLEGQRSYGANQFGQWAYSAPNANSYISSVTLGPPYVFADHGCTEQQYPQPHNYFGVWSSSKSSWVYVSVNSANQPGGSWGLPFAGDAAIFGLGTGGGISWIPCWRDLYAGGANIWLDDNNWPSVSSVQNPPTSWIRPSTSVHIVAQASDAGLGVQNVVVNSEGSAPIYHIPVQNQCAGTRRSPCLTGHTATIDVHGASFREGRRPAAVTAYDPTGKYSNPYYFETKVDGLAPEVMLNGQLAQATDEDEGAQKGGEDIETLRLPVYNLSIEAKDGSNASDLVKQSGVEDIEVWLDGVEQEVPWPPTPSCASSCPMNQTYQLKLSKLNTSGEHKLNVIVRDFAGNVRERDVRFEYYPATGIKDEYVMQYFPLPDGSGNEAEEVHPRRPELAVNVMNGNLVYRQTDVDVEGAAGLDLEVERYYNSMLPTSQNTEWGDGWTLAQTPDLEAAKTGGQSLPSSPAPDEAVMVDASGAFEDEVHLPTSAGSSKFVPSLQATVTKEAGGGYELTNETGGTAGAVTFDATGQTEALDSDGSAKVDYTYEGGKLSEIEVSDPSTFSADPAELGIPKPQLITKPLYAQSFGSNGSGDGQLKSPADAAVDAQGNLWLVDKTNNRIQKFDATGKFLARFGSTGTANGQFTRPTAIAIAANGDLLVADSGNGRVQRFSSAGVFLSKFGAKGTGNGQFAGLGPEGIAIDTGGNVWVSDTYGGRLQKFNSAGQFVQTVGTKGSGTGQLGEPAGIDIASTGDVWVADRQNNRVSVFGAAGTFLNSFGSVGSGDGQFQKPGEVEIDNLGNVWVGDQGNNRVQQFDLSGQFKGKFGSAGSGQGQFNFAYPMGIATDSRGSLWVTDVNNNRVQKWLVPIERPAYMSAFGSSGTGDGQLQAPGDVAMGVEGNVWVVDKTNNRLQKFDSTGKFLAKVGSLGSGDGQFNRPTGIAIDRDGNLLVADSNNNRIEKFTSDGQFISKFGAVGTGNGKFSSPEGIAADPEGNIWVADSGNGRIEKFDEDGKFIAVVSSKGSGSGQLGKPIGIDLDPEGNIWVGDLQNNRVAVFEPDGTFIRQFGSLGAGAGQFNRPSAVDVDARGNVWVGDQSNHRVERFDLGGNYVGQFGSKGSGAGQFSFPTANTPVGIATDSGGAIWITDVDNQRIQRWQIGNYQAPAEKPLDLSDGDPKVDVATSAGLVGSVTGNAAGTHTYVHSGDDLTAYAGPEGEAKYKYDTAGRMTEVTLPNGTRGQIAYFTDGRVKNVLVDPAGSAPAKTTEFEYQDAPTRRTTVWPSDAPHTTYDIGTDGSVLKWWNAAHPPTIEPLKGNLYDNRETASPISAGDYYLTASAWDAEGIRSIDVIINGNQVVDEWTCPVGSKCISPVPLNEWVAETGEFAPGILNVEVLVTDQIGESAAERFWVNIPQTPPPAPGVPAPPKFKDIKKFREDFGLEVIFPVANEVELDERIFNLIGAWHNPASPAGQVARASCERWGVPLRPEDVAELEYRERYIEQDGPLITQWGEDNHPSTFAGYWVDHRAGGIIRVGLTSDQTNAVTALKQSAGLQATDRMAAFPTTPAHPISELVSLQGAIGIGDAAQGSLAGQIRRVGFDVRSNVVTVGATNQSAVEAGLKAHYGGSAPIQVSLDSGSGSPLLAHITDQGPLKSGQLIAIFSRIENGEKIYNVCTAGPLATESVGSKPNGERKLAYFLLTAGHCGEEGKPVFRVKDYGPGGKVVPGDEIGEQRTRRWQLYPDSSKFEDDGAAIRLDSDTAIAGRIVEGGLIKGKAPVEIGMTVCESLGVSERVICQPIEDYAELMPFYPAIPGSGPFWQMKANIPVIDGDSGAPVYSRKTMKVVGLNVYGPPSQFTPLMAPPLPEEGPYPYFKPSRDQAPGLLNEPFMGDLSILTE